VSTSEKIAYRPLGIISNCLAELGLEVTHCYEDLIFVQHNAFLLRMEKKGEDVSLFFNVDSDPAKREEIAASLRTQGSTHGLVVKEQGTYQLTEDEENNTIDIEFFESAH
jgi:hypothetical protein